MTVKSRKHHGVTFVEAMIGLMIASLLMLTSYKVFSYIISQRNKGTVDLQELQGARSAINFLRRDFRCAAPLINSSARLEQRKKATRVPIIESAGINKDDETVPIVISESEIHFFRHVFTTSLSSVTPETEQINYRIDPARKCLVRSAAGEEKIFNDIKDVRFELYAHPLKTDIPMLMVTMRIDADPDEKAAGRNYFELTTTISSAIANQNVNNPFWNITTY
jgi:Tfp pilus assembly protein FimT